MVAYTYRLPAGIPGDVNRIAAATIEAAVITPSGTTGHPTAYGVPVVIDATTGNVRTMVGTDTAAYGVLVRPYPTGGSQDALGTSTPPADGTCDVLVRGYISVLLGAGSAAAVKGTPLNIWTATVSGNHTQGSFEAAASGGNTIAPANSYFMGPADTNSIVEIAFNI